MIDRTQQTGDISQSLVPGSAATIPGVGFGTDSVSVSLGGLPAPVISIRPTAVTVQAPWELSSTADALPVQVDSAATSSPFVPATSTKGVVRPLAGRFIELPSSPSPYGGFDVLAIHQNWDGIITADHPAKPGEIVHLYAAGLGPVTNQPATGEPAPADPLSRISSTLTCWAYSDEQSSQLDIPVQFAGLAPGTIGYYQIDVQLPPAHIRLPFQLNCNQGSEDTDMAGSFAVQP
jgi:uncharacterized protein (TIGR03437 family)